MGQDVVGHDLGQRSVARVGDRETVGAIGTRVDLCDLAGGDEVRVLVALDFLGDIHARGRGDLKVHAGVAQEVRRRAILVEIERVLSATADAVLEVTDTAVLVIGLRSAARHERPGGIRGVAGRSGGQDLGAIP